MLEVSVFLDADDVHEGNRTYEYIVRYLMHHQVMGASVFEAMSGYGNKHHFNHPGIIGGTDEEPIMIVFIDDDDKVRAVLPHIKEVTKGGLIVLKRVERA